MQYQKNNKERVSGTEVYSIKKGFDNFVKSNPLTPKIIILTA